MNSPLEIVKRYSDHVNAHELDAAMAYLADSFELRFRGSDFVMSKEAARQALSWDLGTNGRSVWRNSEADGASVTIEGYETNDFLSLIGIEELPFRSTFAVNDEGKIESQLHEVDWGSLTLDEAMKPLINWASQHEPSELEVVYPHGQMVYTQEIAKRWVALARRWRNNSGD